MKQIRCAVSFGYRMKRGVAAGMLAAVCAAAMLLAGSGQGKAAERETASAGGFREYSGYLDACRGWKGRTAFAGQDYDGDGKTDRVYRTYLKDSEFCRYRIEFGNQTVLAIRRKVCYDGKPVIKSADINGDGEREIIFSQQYELSTDMRELGDTAVFEKKGNAYVQARLPFEQTGQGYAQEAVVHYQKKRGQLITVSLDGTDFRADVPIRRELWVDGRYREHYKNISLASTVWDTFLTGDGKDVKLACKLHLFDKWSEYGLVLILDYENQRYVVKEVLLASEEF